MYVSVVIHFHCCVVFHCMNIPQTIFIYSPVDEHMYFSHFALVWIKLLWTFFYKYFLFYFCFFLSISWIWIAGLQNRYVFNFIRKYETLANVIITLITTVYYKYSHFSHLLQHLYTPSHEFCTFCIICQVHSSLRYLCGLCTHTLPLFAW